MDFSRKLSFIVLVLCVLISLKNQIADYSTGDSHVLLGVPSAERKLQENVSADHSLNQGLKYDYYHESCPVAERIVRSSVQRLFNDRHDVAPALLRLVFHDCFIEGCDASVLLDSDVGMESEKDSPPNHSLKGFDAIDFIKSELEAVCPGIVSCADALVLAAREAVLLIGGPFYPLLTGRKDSTVAYKHNATYELPGPDFDLSTAIHSFSTRGFDERDTVSLLGAHSTGTIHCTHFRARLYNTPGRDGPDPSIDPEFLEVMRSSCIGSNRSSPSPSPSSADNSSSSEEDPTMRMDYEGPGKGFGTVYYHALLNSRGLLFVDQQMTAGEKTKTWVEAYASEPARFQRDFGLSMMKLSNLRPLTAPMGQVRLNCHKVN